MIYLKRFIFLIICLITSIIGIFIYVLLILVLVPLVMPIYYVMTGDFEKTEDFVFFSTMDKYGDIVMNFIDKMQTKIVK